MTNFIFNNFLYKPFVSQIILFLSRISIGLFFFTTGFNKVFVEKNSAIMLETIAAAGIPYPEFTAVIISLFELVFGFFMIIGLLTQISGIILFFICFVALCTVGIYIIPTGESIITWLSWFFYIHDFIYMMILGYLITNKSKILSIDMFLEKYIHRHQ